MNSTLKKTLVWLVILAVAVVAAKLTPFWNGWLWAMPLLVVASAISDISGILVKRVVDGVTAPYAPPAKIDADQWDQIIISVHEITDVGRLTGALLGVFERFLFIVSIWFGAVLLIPAWMAIKVATKWNVWSAMLDQAVYFYDDGHDRKYDFSIHMRRYLGWRLSQRFLIGMILNILIAGAAVGLLLVMAQLIGINWRVSRTL